MPYDLKWLIEDHVYLVKIGTDFTYDDVQSLQDRDLEIHSVSPTRQVHTILDTADLVNYPTNLAKIISKVNINQYQQMKSSHGWVIMYGLRNPLIGFIMTSISQLLNIRFRHVDTMEEALQFLGESMPEFADRLNELAQQRTPAD